MKDPIVHLILFVILSAVIVLMGTFYAEPDDSVALRAFPRRLFVFFVGCGALVCVLLLAEYTVASVN
ncbi:MAG: hypothetical protein ACI9F9_002576 [Candidatus Paceibacteria bacterium]|jgi:hypothetical protein